MRKVETNFTRPHPARHRWDRPNSIAGCPRPSPRYRGRSPAYRDWENRGPERVLCYPRAPRSRASSWRRSRKCSRSTRRSASAPRRRAARSRRPGSAIAQYEVGLVVLLHGGRRPAQHAAIKCDDQLGLARKQVGPYKFSGKPVRRPRPVACGKRRRPRRKVANRWPARSPPRTRRRIGREKFRRAVAGDASTMKWW